MKAVLVGVAVLTAALAGCSDRDSDAETSAAAAEKGRDAVQAPAVQASSPLGGGSALTGRVEGLKGEITGFAFRQTATQTIVELAADVLFAFDSAELTPQSEAALRRTAELAVQAGAGPIQVVGHTDAQGEDAYNMALSQRRAEAVSRWLTASGGVPASRLQAEGRGETEPVAPNIRPDGQDDPNARARNRRVVVIMARADG